MTWYSPPKTAAADPDNPTADEQFPFSEFNAMVTYLKDRINNHVVNAAAIGDNKILVYKAAGAGTFVFEDQTTIAALNDIPDVVISGVPADNEVVAYDTATTKFINQTAAEAGLATVAGLAAYLPLAGGTMTGTLDMEDNLIDDVDDIQAFDTAGIRCRNSAGDYKINLAAVANSFIAYAEANMNSNKIIGVTDPADAQDASTKSYDDTHLVAKDFVIPGAWTNGNVPVYKTSDGKFHMEAQGGGLWTALSDTPSSIAAGEVVRGNAGGTAIEFSGIAETAYFLATGARPMAGTVNMADFQIYGVNDIQAYDSFGIRIRNDAAANKITLCYAGYSFAAYAQATMNGFGIKNIGDLILNDATELTIVTGAITATQSYHKIDTEADAATDDLVTISGGTAGQVLTIRATDSARTVVAKNGTGNLLLEADRTLDNAADTLSLLYDGSNWLETGFANNGA